MKNIMNDEFLLGRTPRSAFCGECGFMMSEVSFGSDTIFICTQCGVEAEPVFLETCFYEGQVSLVNKGNCVVVGNSFHDLDCDTAASTNQLIGELFKIKQSVKQLSDREKEAKELLVNFMKDKHQIRHNLGHLKYHSEKKSRTFDSKKLLQFVEDQFGSQALSLAKKSTMVEKTRKGYISVHLNNK